jgi:hypothetical protein
LPSQNIPACVPSLSLSLPITLSLSHTTPSPLFIPLSLTPPPPLPQVCQSMTFLLRGEVEGNVLRSKYEQLEVKVDTLSKLLLPNYTDGTGGPRSMGITLGSGVGAGVVESGFSPHTYSTNGQVPSSIYPRMDTSHTFPTQTPGLGSGAYKKEYEYSPHSAQDLSSTYMSAYMSYIQADDVTAAKTESQQGGLGVRNAENNSNSIINNRQSNVYTVSNNAHTQPKQTPYKSPSPVTGPKSEPGTGLPLGTSTSDWLFAVSPQKISPPDNGVRNTGCRVVAGGLSGTQGLGNSMAFNIGDSVVRASALGPSGDRDRDSPHSVTYGHGISADNTPTEGSKEPKKRLFAQPSHFSLPSTGHLPTPPHTHTHTQPTHQDNTHTTPTLSESFQMANSSNSSHSIITKGTYRSEENSYRTDMYSPAQNAREIVTKNLAQSFLDVDASLNQIDKNRNTGVESYLDGSQRERGKENINIINIPDGVTYSTAYPYSSKSEFSGGQTPQIRASQQDPSPVLGSTPYTPFTSTYTTVGDKNGHGTHSTSQGKDLGPSVLSHLSPVPRPAPVPPSSSSGSSTRPPSSATSVYHTQPAHRSTSQSSPTMHSPHSSTSSYSSSAPRPPPDTTDQEQGSMYAPSLYVPLPAAPPSHPFSAKNMENPLSKPSKIGSNKPVYDARYGSFSRK